MKEARLADKLSIPYIIIIINVVILPGAEVIYEGGSQNYQSYYSISRARSAFKCC